MYLLYCHGDHTANLKIRVSGQDGFSFVFCFGLCHCAACGILRLGFSPCLRTWLWERRALPGPPGNSPWIISSSDSSRKELDKWGDFVIVIIFVNGGHLKSAEYQTLISMSS